MWAGESGDDFRPCGKIKVDQASQGMMPEIDVVFDGQRSKAARAVERVGPGSQFPATRLVTTDLCTRGPKPAITTDNPGHGSRRSWIHAKYGVKGENPGARDTAIAHDHGSSKISGPSSFGINSLTSADVTSQFAYEAQVS